MSDFGSVMLLWLVEADGLVGEEVEKVWVWVFSSNGIDWDTGIKFEWSDELVCKDDSSSVETEKGCDVSTKPFSCKNQ